MDEITCRKKVADLRDRASRREDSLLVDLVDLLEDLIWPAPPAVAVAPEAPVVDPTGQPAPAIEPPPVDPPAPTEAPPEAIPPESALQAEG